MIRGLLCENLAVLGSIDPDANGVGALNTDWVDMSKFNQALFIVQVGEFAAGGTADFKLEEATSAAGAGAQDISGKSITQLTDAGTDDDKQALVNIQAAELSDGYRYVRGVLTIAVAAVDSAVIALGGAPTYLPASDFDLASVDEIVE